ncbi:MAG: hypothetical protein AB8F65_10600 [Woeseiaceae bacterium]
MGRYSATGNQGEQERNLRFAVDEFGYSMGRVPVDSYLFPEVAINYSVALRKIGEQEQAVELLNQAILEHPKYASAYAAMSIMYRELEQPDKQLEILKDGLAATDGESAELHYFTGLALAKRKQYEEAKQHAIQAYRLGYPLPGLKRRLARAGYRLTDDS